MNSLHLYKHIHCLDMCIRPLKKYWIPEKDGWKIKVEYWLDRPVPLRMGYIQTIFIKRKDVPNWKELT